VKGQLIGKNRSKQKSRTTGYLEGPEIAKTTIFFSIRACPRAAIANSQGLLLGLFSAKNDHNRCQMT
jgi:hypothetical protein